MLSSSNEERAFLRVEKRVLGTEAMECLQDREKSEESWSGGQRDQTLQGSKTGEREKVLWE